MFSLRPAVFNLQGSATDEAVSTTVIYCVSVGVKLTIDISVAVDTFAYAVLVNVLAATGKLALQ